MSKAAIKFNGIDPSSGRMFNVTCPFCKEEDATIDWHTNLLECEDCGKQANIYVYYAELGEVGGPAKDDTEVVADDNGRFSHIENHLAFLEDALKKVHGNLLEVKLRPQPDMTVVGDKFNRINNAMNETENRIAVVEKRLHEVEVKEDSVVGIEMRLSEINERLDKWKLKDETGIRLAVMEKRLRTIESHLNAHFASHQAPSNMFTHQC